MLKLFAYNSSLAHSNLA